jgi:hypothetical protein
LTKATGPPEGALCNPGKSAPLIFVPLDSAILRPLLKRKEILMRVTPRPPHDYFVKKCEKGDRGLRVVLFLKLDRRQTKLGTLAAAALTWPTGSAVMAGADNPK